VKDRVGTNASDGSPRKPLKDLEMREFLPTPEVHDALVQDITMLIPRILVKYLPAYQAFKNTVKYNIPHKHSAEMCTKSQVVYIL
jgi:hypothetical protein